MNTSLRSCRNGCKKVYSGQCQQARHQDFTTGGGDTWGTHFLIQYWTYAATGGSNMKWEAHVSNGGAGHHWIPAGDDPEYQ